MPRRSAAGEAQGAGGLRLSSPLTVAGGGSWVQPHYWALASAKVCPTYGPETNSNADLVLLVKPSDSSGKQNVVSAPRLVGCGARGGNRGTDRHSRSG